MSASSMEIPVFHISFCIPQGKEFPFEDPSEIPLIESNVSPTDFKLHSIVSTILISLAKDISFHHGKAFPEGLRCRVILSQHSGVEVDDQYIGGLLKTAFEGVGCPVPVAVARDSGMMGLKQAAVSEQVRKVAIAQLQSEVLFFDPVSTMLFKGGQRGPFVVDMRISQFSPANKGGGLTTAAFRFPHMYAEMLDRFEYRRINEDLEVCIVGPGLQSKAKSLAYCPQLAELMAIFPRGRFTLLDNDTKALEVMKGQIERMKVIAYDPLVFRTLIMDIPENYCKAPDTMQPGLKLMADYWTTKAKAPKNVGEMLKGTCEASMLLLNVDSGQVGVREFDINTPTFASEEQYDVMVATMSILLAFGGGKVDIKKIFPSYLNALKENGSLYMDAQLMQAVLLPAYDCVTPEKLAEKLSKELDGNFSVRRVGLESYQKENTCDIGLLPRFDLVSVSSDQKGTPTITTSTIYVLTKESES